MAASNHACCAPGVSGSQKDGSEDCLTLTVFAPSASALPFPARHTHWRTGGLLSVAARASGPAPPACLGGRAPAPRSHGLDLTVLADVCHRPCRCGLPPPPPLPSPPPHHTHAHTHTHTHTHMPAARPRLPRACVPRVAGHGGQLHPARKPTRPLLCARRVLRHRRRRQRRVRQCCVLAPTLRAAACAVYVSATCRCGASLHVRRVRWPTRWRQLRLRWRCVRCMDSSPCDGTSFRRCCPAV